MYTMDVCHFVAVSFPDKIHVHCTCGSCAYAKMMTFTTLAGNEGQVTRINLVWPYFESY